MSRISWAGRGTAVAGLAIAAVLGAGCGSSSGGGATPPSTTPTGTGAGSGSMAILQVGGSTYAFVPSPTGVSAVKIGSATLLASAGGSPLALSSATSRAITLTVLPDACAADWVNAKVICGSFSSGTVTVIDASSTAFTATSYDTGLTSSVSYSGGSCVVCGLLYDPKEDETILATAAGYSFFDHLKTHAITRTIAASVAENFGYDPVTDQIFSPQYQTSPASIDVVPAAGTNVYSLSPSPATLSSPDHGAVDSSTGVAITAEEYSLDAYLVALGTEQLGAPSAGAFTALEATLPLNHTQDCSWPLSDIAVESSAHLAFFSAEFCNAGNDMMGVAQLPRTAPVTAADLTISDYAFAHIPDPATGITWTSPGDPHGIANFTLSAGTLHYGLLVNADKTYVAVVDLVKLLAAPRDATDAHLVAPTYDLVANGVVTFFLLP